MTLFALSPNIDFKIRIGITRIKAINGLYKLTDFAVFNVLNDYYCTILSFHFLQKVVPAFTSFVRNISADKTLKEVLAEKIPIEQENVKAFRKSHGSTKVGEVTVDMVRY